MSRNRLLVVAVSLLAVAALAFLMLRPHGGEEADAEVNPTAVVTVAALRGGQVLDTVSAYGVVAADPASAFTVAAPKPAIVTRILVRTGQTVAAGQALAELADTPASELAYRQAADAASFARADLTRVQRLYDERLAANDQLEAARKMLADAEATLSAQRKQGAGRAVYVLTAPRAAVVTNVAAAPGDHLAQDAAVVVLANLGAATAKLGLQPGSGAFAPGQAVTLRPVGGGAPIVSRISMVGRAADQTTKTLDAVAPLNGAALPIGSAVEGQIVTGAHGGLMAPRGAVVFDETGPHVFTVAGGKAHRVFVQVGPDNGDEVEVKGPLGAGTAVAVEGAYELQDGMTVKVRGR